MGQLPCIPNFLQPVLEAGSGEGPHAGNGSPQAGIKPQGYRDLPHIGFTLFSSVYAAGLEKQKGAHEQLSKCIGQH